MATLVEFLRASKKAVAASCPAALHVVMGNESCDLDSAVSAVVYAFLLHCLQQQSDEGKCEGEGVVPVLNIPARDYPLRTEVTHWLAAHHIGPDHLVFRDEVDLGALQGSGVLRLTLVDHHVLPPLDQHLDQAVTFILDHRPLDRPPDSVAMVVAPVGSCCTLVVEQVVSRLPRLLHLHPDVASLLYGTIVLDTVNLSEAAKKVTPRDVAALDALAPALPAPPNRDAVFQELTQARTNVAGLTAEQLLRKDVKVVTGGGLRVGLASLPMLVQDYLGQDDVDGGVAVAVRAAGYHALLLMGIRVTPDVSRDFALYSPDHALLTQLEEYLRTAAGGLLQLGPLHPPPPPALREDYRAFRQDNVAASRKVVLPLVKEWLASRTT